MSVFFWCLLKQAHLKKWIEQAVPVQKSAHVTVNGQVLSDVSICICGIRVCVCVCVCAKPLAEKNIV